MITVRVDPDTELHLDRVARVQGLSRSELVRRAIDTFLSKYKKPSAYDLGKDLFGKYGSAEESLSKQRKEIVKNEVQRKWNG